MDVRELEPQSEPGDVLVIGAGPAGLTAAHQLAKAGLKPRVLEKDGVMGGISRTVSYKGYHFDIGGHRFFTKIPAVQAFWHDVLKDDFLLRSRTSRIYYGGKFFYYPLRAWNALTGLGVWDSTRVLVSYALAHLFPIRPEHSFEHWVVNRFGSRLFEIFFKTYTEKVWGIPCSEISADWAAQRIMGLSLRKALVDAFLRKRSQHGREAIKTLVEQFHYPRLGPGMMWDQVARDLQHDGGEVLLHANVSRIRHEGGRVTALEVSREADKVTLSGKHVISSMPMRELVRKLDPAPPQTVLNAAEKLRYRDFLTVALIVDGADLFPDNWIYIHDESVRVGRIQNFKNWSADMVPDSNKTCLGLEYFCFEGDGLWTMSDKALLELAGEELRAIGLIENRKIEDGTVVRMPKAYPVYDSDYSESVRVIGEYVAGLENLQLVGRNGMHKYNNQDHSMLTAMLAVENILGADHDLWSVNEEQHYHEELRVGEESVRLRAAAVVSTQPRVPERMAAGESTSELLAKTLARIDKASLAIATGLVCACILALSTAWLAIVGDAVAIRQFNLIGQYFYGYAFTLGGVALGCIHAFLWGFVFGWLFAYARNLAVGIYVSFAARRAISARLSHVLDYI